MNHTGTASVGWALQARTKSESGADIPFQFSILGRTDGTREYKEVLPEYSSSPKPRVQNADPDWLEVRDIAGNDRHSVHQCGRGDQRIAVGAWIRNLQFPAALGDCHIHRQSSL